ncbi:MAG: sulfate adenylyltransferase subunit CysN, partial [Rhizomicrobium sp.]
MPTSTNSTSLAMFLAEQEKKTLLRFLTCGSVDDGKSTLIGRLLYDSKLLFEDHLATLKKDSQKFGTNGTDIDYALLVDGLEAEREQGITIDVAYRFFATDKRKFIVADTPGHEQYTRNMATGASNAELAVILVDARKGILTQTRRHACIVSLLGIRHVVLAVNKCDLIDFSQSRFEAIAAEFSRFAAPLGFVDIRAIPLSAREGDNVFSRSARTPWYDGPTLTDYLETVDVAAAAQKPLRFPVQWVNRPHADFRGFCGTLAGGHLNAGDDIVVASSGQGAKVVRIITADGDQAGADAGDAVTLTLDREVDISRGDMLCAPDARPEVSDQFAAKLLWMADEAMLPGRSYLLKLATTEVPAQVTALKHQIDVNSLEKLAAKTLKLNEIGVVNISLSRPIGFD